MISFNYFSLSYSSFPWINTYRLTKISVKIGVNKKRYSYLFDLHDKVLQNLVQIMTFYLFNKLDFQSFKFPIDFFGLLPFCLLSLVVLCLKVSFEYLFCHDFFIS